jgi:hypothetical protein
LALLSLALAGCELVKNTGEACLVPKDLMCTCLHDYGEGACEYAEIPWGGESFDLPIEASYTCEGTYPANTALELEVLLYTGGNGYGVKEKCKVKVEGKRLTVEARFWHEPEQDAIREPAVLATCDVPPLAAGTYSLEFGGTEVEVEVGTDEIQDMACALSEDQHNGYD